MLKAIYTDIAQYNCWANERLINNFKLQPETVLDVPIQSSFSSIRETLLHLWGAEHLWLDRLQGNSPGKFPTDGFAGSTAELFDGLLASSNEFQAFLEEQEEAFFAVGKCNYENTTGAAFSQFNREVIHHCMNHSTYHRGQLVTLSRKVGINTIPATDYIYYLRYKKS